MGEDERSCCAPSNESVDASADGGATTGHSHHRTDPASDSDDRTKGMVRLDGGTLRMGTDEDVGYPEDGEGPARDVTDDPFFVDKYAVTNAQFLEFVRETGYTTVAERYGWSFVFHEFVAPSGSRSRARSGGPSSRARAGSGRPGPVRTSSRRTC